MPVHKIKGGYKFGKSGKTYRGKGAKKKAEIGESDLRQWIPGGEEEMKVWVVKHALTQGILEMDVERQSDDGKTVYGRAWNQSYRGQGIEWCKTKSAAIERAKEMRDKKIISLKKQIEKLENMRFE